MHKKIALALVVAWVMSGQEADAQQYACKSGKIHFFSKSPIEDIEAVSKNAVCVVNASTAKVVAKIPVKTFGFKDKLMEEHFNENYLETDIFPNAGFDAAIAEKIDYAKDGVYDVTLKGTLDLHGVKQPREVRGKLTVKNGQIANATADFNVKLADHKIKIPKAVVMNIAEEIKVDLNFDFEPYVK